MLIGGPCLDAPAAIVDANLDLVRSIRIYIPGPALLLPGYMLHALCHVVHITVRYFVREQQSVSSQIARCLDIIVCVTGAYE